MSQQLQITGGAKVRNLEGAIVGSSGVLSSVGLGVAYGVATLGADGKVPSSQLPSLGSSYKGTWKLFFQNMKYGIDEYRRAFSKKLFLQTLQVLIPSLTMNDIVPGRSGVRALLLGEDGDTRDDFRIEYHGNSIHVLNAPSPAATASLAIGGFIADEAEKHFGLK